MDFNILIVEDDLIIALDIRKMLLSKGYKIVGPVSSISGIKKILNISKVDLIISDLILDKNSLNFDKLISYLISLQKPFIILSSVSNTSEMNKKFLPSKINFLAKPFESTELLKKIDDILNNLPS